MSDTNYGEWKPLRYIDIKKLDGPVSPNSCDDTLPLMSFVPEPPPSHWGKITSKSRDSSEQYQKFLGKKK